VLNRPGKPAVEERVLKMKTVEVLIGIVEELWGRVVEFEDDVPPQEVLDQVQLEYELLEI